MGAREIRKLSETERGKAGALHETSFPADSQAFVEDSYGEAASRNEIYGALEGEELLAVVRLNPYELVVGKKECEVPYIASAAVREENRRQELMTALFQTSLKDFWKKKAPFAFLRNSREALCQPCGFSWIYAQNQMELHVKDYLGKEMLESHPASCADVPDLAWISKRLLADAMGTYAKRTESYYERILLEQEARDGDIAVLARDGMICGWFFCTVENGVPKVHEAVVEKELEPLLLPTIADCFRYDETVQMHGFSEKLGGKQEPFMMGRIVNLSSYCTLVEGEIPEGFSFGFTDHLIPENNGVYVWSRGKLERAADDREVPVFSAEEFMGKFPLPGPVFLNELV